MTDTSSTNHSRRSQETRIHSKLVAPQATLYGDHVSGGATHTLPYRVQLDSGAAVLAHRHEHREGPPPMTGSVHGGAFEPQAHRDEHWLVRNLALQAEWEREIGRRKHTVRTTTGTPTRYGWTLDGR